MDHERDDGRPELDEIDATASLAPDLTAAFFAALDEGEGARAPAAPADLDGLGDARASAPSMERRLDALLDLTAAFDAFRAPAPIEAHVPVEGQAPVEAASRVEPLALLPPHVPDLHDDSPSFDGGWNGHAAETEASAFLAASATDPEPAPAPEADPEPLAFLAAPAVLDEPVASVVEFPSIAPSPLPASGSPSASAPAPAFAEVATDDAAADAPLDLEEFIVFSLADTRCVVPIRNVVEVGRIPEAAPVPHAPAWLHGLGNLRGQVLSLIDLRAFLGLGRIRPSAGRMIVLRADADEVVAGLMVDHVHQIVQLAPSRFQAAPSTLAPGYGGFVWGVCDYGLHTMVGLDVDSVLGAEALHGEGALSV